MKRYVYVLFLAVSLLGITSCSKNDPAPASPAIGRWALNRGLLSGFPSASNINGAAIDLYYFESIGSTIDVFSDNTFNLNYKNVVVDDQTGTWTFDNNTTLTLTYDTGGQESYTYAKTKNIEELTSTKPVSYTLPVSTTAVAVGQLTPVYRK